MTLEKTIGDYYKEYRSHHNSCAARQTSGKFVYCCASDPSNPIDCPFVNGSYIVLFRTDSKGNRYEQRFNGCDYDN